MQKSQPPDPSPLRFTITNLAVTIPTVVAMLAVAGLIGLPLGLTYRAGMEALPGQEQLWTAGVQQLSSAASASLLGALPGPVANQRRPPCALELGEEEVGGVCWIWLGKPPPCPVGQAWERNGRCYARVLEVKRLPREPTTGEPRPGNVAGSAP